MTTYLQALLASSAGVKEKRGDGVKEAKSEAPKWYKMDFFFFFKGKEDSKKV